MRPLTPATLAALVDINGDLVGINTAILSESGGNQGIGLAIPANLVRSIETQLADSPTHTVTRGWLGVIAEPLTGDIVDRLNLTTTGGVLVTNIYTNSPAGGLGWGDQETVLILKVNGQDIDSPGQLRNLIADLAPGTSITLSLWENGQTRDRTVQIATRPERVQGV